MSTLTEQKPAEEKPTEQKSTEKTEHASIDGTHKVRIIKKIK